MRRWHHLFKTRRRHHFNDCVLVSDKDVRTVWSDGLNTPVQSLEKDYEVGLIRPKAVNKSDDINGSLWYLAIEKQVVLALVSMLRVPVLSAVAHCSHDSTPWTCFGAHNDFIGRKPLPLGSQSERVVVVTSNQCRSSRG